MFHSVLAIMLLLGQWDWVTMPPGQAAPPPTPYAQALKAAAADGRPLVVLIGTSWCSPCQETKQALQDSSEWVFCYVDQDDYPKTAMAVKLPGKDAIPQTHVFVPRNGRMLKAGTVIGRTGPAMVCKVISPPVSSPKEARRQPRGSLRARWTWPGHPSAAALEAHLAGSPHNYSLFWLRTLTDAELGRLHDSDHERTGSVSRPVRLRQSPAYCPT